MLRKIKFLLWVVTFVAASVASLSVVWSLVSGGLADVIRIFDLEDVAVVVACLVLAGPVGFMALSLDALQRIRPPTHPGSSWGLGSGALWLRWIAAGTLGATLTDFVVGQWAADAVVEALFPELLEVSWVHASMVLGTVRWGSMLLGIAGLQWLVVRRRLAWAPWLVLSRGVGGAVGGATIHGVSMALAPWSFDRFDAAMPAMGVALIVGLLAVALAEWLVLPGRVAGDAKLAWVGAAAMVVGVGLVGVAGMEMGALAGCVFGTCHAVVTGFAIVPRARGAVSSPPPENAPERSAASLSTG